MKNCPYCCEENQNSAKKCKYCGESFSKIDEHGKEDGTKNEQTDNTNAIFGSIDIPVFVCLFLRLKGSEWSLPERKVSLIVLGIYGIFKLIAGCIREEKNKAGKFLIFSGLIYAIVGIFGACYINYYIEDPQIEDKKVEENSEIDWSGLMPSEEELELRKYDEELCENKKSYEKYIEKKFDVLDFSDFDYKQSHFDIEDDKIYYSLDYYDMVHNNELDTCIAAYKLDYLLPIPNPHLDGYREFKYSRYIVDSKNDKVLWEKSAQGILSHEKYDEELWNELDKYRDNLVEREQLRNKELEESTPYNSPILDKADGTIFFPDINSITQELFGKSYTDKFSDEEKIKIQEEVNKEAGFGHPRYIVLDWNSKGGIRVVDAVKKKIQTVDISSIDLVTNEDYIYNDGDSEKILTYMEDYGVPEDSGCYGYHNLEEKIKCPDDMYPKTGTKMCFDLNKKEEIDCRLIKF